MQLRRNSNASDVIYFETSWPISVLASQRIIQLVSRQTLWRHSFRTLQVLDSDFPRSLRLQPEAVTGATTTAQRHLVRRSTIGPDVTHRYIWRVSVLQALKLWYIYFIFLFFFLVVQAFVRVASQPVGTPTEQAAPLQEDISRLRQHQSWYSRTTTHLPRVQSLSSNHRTSLNHSYLMMTSQFLKSCP